MYRHGCQKNTIATPGRLQDNTTTTGAVSGIRIYRHVGDPHGSVQWDEQPEIDGLSWLGSIHSSFSNTFSSL
jgi:hypothetical protein